MGKNIIITEKQFDYIIKNMRKMPMLNEIYQETRNDSYPISLNETNAKRLIDRHTANGYAIISACRGGNDFGLGDSQRDKDRLAQINKERMRELIADIQKAGFSYTLSYGGFIENKGTENEEGVYERSVIVYAEKRDGSVDMNGLKDFAIAECKKFNQDNVLVVMPNEKPKYINQKGGIDFELDGQATFNDISQTYFTDLHKNTQDKIKQGSKPTRFSFNESLIAPIPQCYSERHVRSLKGEVFLLR